MTNHPNRNRHRRSKETPPADLIRQTRKEAGLTQAQAASFCHRSERAWQNAEEGSRFLDSAAWELFLLKIDRHPTHLMVDREGRRPSPNARWYDPI